MIAENNSNIETQYNAEQELLFRVELNWPKFDFTDTLQNKEV